MRLVFFNHSHPQLHHVSGVRLWGFAKAMAARGHQIVQVTSTLTADESQIAVGEFRQVMRQHDWSAPFHLAVHAKDVSLLQAIRGDTFYPLSPVLT